MVYVYVIIIFRKDIYYRKLTKINYKKKCKNFHRKDIK